MSDLVLDASAVIALVRREPGGDVVEGVLPQSVIASVNHSEVVARMVDEGMSDRDIRDNLAALALDVAPFDTELAEQAGLLRRATRGQGLSLGDRACLAFAKRLGLPALTADRRWAELDIGVEVVLIR